MEVQIRERVSSNNVEVVNYLDEWKDYVLGHRGIDHPFLNDFATSKTNIAEIRKTFLEFYYFIHHLPFYIAGMATSTRDERVLREIVINVAEEVGEKDKTPHLDIYRDFMTKLDISDPAIARYSPLDSTLDIDRGVDRLYTKSPIEKALGAMYALETMSSVMVDKLNCGLAKSGFDENVRYFFIFHIEGEKGHSNGAFNAILPYLEISSNKKLFEEGIKEFMKLIEHFWDGVGRLCHQSAR